VEIDDSAGRKESYIAYDLEAIKAGEYLEPRTLGFSTLRQLGQADCGKRQSPLSKQTELSKQL
jgi:hypothetical protein